MRRFLTPSWVARHILLVVLVAAFLLLGYWQLRRGEDGNVRSYAYALQWPLFAVFAVAMWVRMIREDLAGGSGAPQRPDHPVSTSAAAIAVQLDEDEDPELAAYNRYLARLTAKTQRQYQYH